jgi:hypothetical protein
MKNLLTKIKEWSRDGKTGVPELIQENDVLLRRLMYERDTAYLLWDIEIKYPSLKGRRDEIMAALSRYHF